MQNQTLALLKQLSDGEFHSGPELGQILGISRTAIWKYVEKLKQWHIPITSNTNKGYQIVGGLDLMSVEKITAFLPEWMKDKFIFELHEVIESTNSLAMQRAQQQLIHQHAFLAEMQTAGKGRRGRCWVSPFASSIYCSLGWRFHGGVEKLQGLSLVMAIAVIHTLEKLGVAGCQVKWPNDILCLDKKLAGILIEVFGNFSDYCDVIIGVGLNVKNPHSEMQEIDRPWIDVFSILHDFTDNVPSRNQITAELLNQFAIHLEQFDKHGFSYFSDEWQTYDVYLGRKVRIEMPEKSLHGIYHGIESQTGALQLKTEEGMMSIFGGEVSLRV